MNLPAPLRLIAIAVIIAAIVALTVAFATSLSVGGAIYGGDPAACASCHFEKPYYEGWRASIHGKSDVKCKDCHNVAEIGRLTSEIFTRQASCVGCHSSEVELLNATKFYGYWPIPARIIIEVNPHNKLNHFADVPCAQCHLEHKIERGVRRMVSVNPCVQCHGVASPEEGPRLGR